MNGLAIVLPGRGYSAQGPALRLPILAAEQAGYETTVIEYPVETLEAKDWDAVAESARRQVQQALSCRNPGCRCQRQLEISHRLRRSRPVPRRRRHQ